MAGLPTPVPFLQEPLQIGLQQTDGPRLRRFSRAVRQISGSGERLFSLGFDNCSFTEDDFATLPDLPQLHQVAFFHSNVDAGMIRQLVRFPTLGNLTLNTSAVDDEILAAMPLLPKVTHVDLRHSRVRGPGLAGLPQQLPSVTALGLMDTELTSEGVAALPGFAKLEILVLDNTAIDDGAMEQLLQLPPLRYLSVADTQLTEQGLGRLKGKFPGLRVPVE